MKRFIILSGSIILIFAVSSSLAAIPRLINYQGMLTDDSGDPLNGNYDIIFKIYNHIQAGNKIWEESHTDVPVTNGLFNVILGSVTLLDLTFYEAEEYWLDVTVEGEHMPRLRLTSVAFAYRAAVADSSEVAHRAWLADSARVALSALSGGGWVDDGGVIRLQTSTDRVAIGITEPTARLHVAGSANEPSLRATSSTTYGYAGSFVSNGGRAYAGWFVSNNYRGIYGRGGTGWYAAYFDGPIYADSYTGGLITYLGLNDDDQPLEPGDVVVVSGLVPPVAGPTPIIKVRKTDEGNGAGVIGVVRNRYVFQQTAGDRGPETGGRFDMEAKNIAPGEHLSIVTQGMAQVKVDASSGAVAPGALLTVSTVDGSARKAEVDPHGRLNSGPILGKALEAGTGLIWVMVTLK
jgi:hypothetical protein